MNAPSAAAAEPLFDASNCVPGRWWPVHDTVMGGRSDGGMHASAAGVGVFRGVLSLENGGGFASVRTLLHGEPLAGAGGLRIRVRGDGRRYVLYLKWTCRMTADNYRYEFGTEHGEWTEIDVPFGAFVRTRRGKPVEGAEPVEPASIRMLGFLVSGSQAGPFALEIGSISVLA